MNMKARDIAHADVIRVKGEQFTVVGIGNWDNVKGANANDRKRVALELRGSGGESLRISPYKDSMIDVVEVFDSENPAMTRNHTYGLL